MKKIIMMVLVLCMGFGVTGCNKTYSVEDTTFDLLESKLKKETRSDWETEMGLNYTSVIIPEIINTIGIINKIKTSEYDEKEILVDMVKILEKSNEYLGEYQKSTAKYFMEISNIISQLISGIKENLKTENEYSAKVYSINKSIDEIGSWFKNGDLIIDSLKITNDEYKQFIEKIGKLNKQ